MINQAQEGEFWRRRLAEYIDYSGSPDQHDGFGYILNIERALDSGEFDDELLEY